MHIIAVIPRLVVWGSVSEIEAVQPPLV